jgi:hypothetical protein
MTGQIIFRKTNQKSKSGKDVYMVIGVIGLDDSDEYEDGIKYDILDICANNPEDVSAICGDLSPEELLEEKIWRVK